MISMKRVFCLILAMTLAASFCSCSTRTVTIDEYMSFTDDAARQVTLYSKPQKVAVLFSSLADVWMLAGGRVDITVGESIERGFADANAVLVDAGAGKAINTELLIEAKPDFVICSADIEAQIKAAELLKSTGTPSACFRIESFEDYLRVLSLFCEITQNTTAYEKYGTEVLTKVSQQLSHVENGGRAREALFLRAGSTPSSVKAKGHGDHFAAAMLTQLGVKNIADDSPVLIDSLSIEEILIRNPEYIFISTMGDEISAKKNVEKLFTSPQWNSLSAIQNGKYIFLPKELFHYKPNARWDEAYKFLVDFIYE